MRAGFRRWGASPIPDGSASSNTTDPTSSPRRGLGQLRSGSSSRTETFEKRMARSRTCAMSTIFTDPANLTHDQLEEGTAFAPRFDAHGLITAVAQEVGSNRVLMVAHMNAEALARTIDT